MSKAKPFVHWAGGKNAILPQLISNLPQKNNFDNYFEPFLGAGSLFFGISDKINLAHLSDINEDLMRAYRVIQEDCDRLVQCLKLYKLEHSKRGKEFYLEIRNLHNKTLSGQIRPRLHHIAAARFIFLNKTCFNGLYRVNKKGEFNTSYGKYKNPSIFDPCNLANISVLLNKKAMLSYGGYQNISHTPSVGDLVYCDPPFDGATVRYSKHDFGDAEQKELAEHADYWNSRGVYVMISNTNTKYINSLYSKKHWRKIIIPSLRVISCDASTRGTVNDLLIVNYG